MKDHEQIMHIVEVLDRKREYKLNGDLISIREFIQDNEDTLTIPEIIEITSLDRGDSYFFGGGAAPEFRLWRTQ